MQLSCRDGAAGTTANSTNGTARGCQLQLGQPERRDGRVACGYLATIVRYGDTGGETVMSARDEVLRWGLVDWVELDRIHWYVARENPDQSLSVIHNKTLGLIYSLVSDGMFELGDLKQNSRFTAWNTPLDESIQRIRDVYTKNFDDQNTWPWFCWLDLTEKGQQVAEAIEANAQSAHGS
jgi:hypothetical protein